MFTRRIQVNYVSDGQARPCALKWIDNFSMRNFTNDAAFDDTLPIADGLMEIGSRVPLDKLESAMQDWFQRKGYIGKQDLLTLTECGES